MIWTEGCFLMTMDPRAPFCGKEIVKAVGGREFTVDSSRKKVYNKRDRFDIDPVAGYRFGQVTML